MTAHVMSEGFKDLVQELQQLEDFFPMLDAVADKKVLTEDVRELELLIASAGEPADEHSLQALLFLQTELARKRALLDDL